MCRSFRDVELFHRIQLDAEPWLLEPSTQRMPWNMQQDWKWSGKNGKIRVGVYTGRCETCMELGLLQTDDGYVRPVPPMYRAIQSVREALEKDDRFEVVDYTPYKTQECVDLAVRTSPVLVRLFDIPQQHSLYFTDGGESVRAAAAESGEPIFPLTEHILNWPTVKKFTIAELWAATNHREEFRMEVAAYWLKSGIDVLLCLATPGPAPKLETTKYWGYTLVPRIHCQRNC
jgi:amidase